MTETKIPEAYGSILSAEPKNEESEIRKTTTENTGWNDKDADYKPFNFKLEVGMLAVIHADLSEIPEKKQIPIKVKINGEEKNRAATYWFLNNVEFPRIIDAGNKEYFELGTSFVWQFGKGTYRALKRIYGRLIYDNWGDIIVYRKTSRITLAKVVISDISGCFEMSREQLIDKYFRMCGVKNE